MLLRKPRQFNFRSTILSHGWSGLLPFIANEGASELQYTFAFHGKAPEKTTIRENREFLEITSESGEGEAFLKPFRHILRLDDDLGEFYQMAASEKDFRWVSKLKAGRLLRSPSVFEDLVKTICTTNCSWALTRKMTANLVEKLGRNGAFPTAEAMAGVSADFYRDEIRAGYRSAYFKELAESVASGRISPESWLDPEIPLKDLKKQLKAVKGVGDYAAENLLKLLGRYEGLALDSWLRGGFYQKYRNGQACPDNEIEAFYERFGKWRGLFIWCDMSRGDL